MSGALRRASHARLRSPDEPAEPGGKPRRSLERTKESRPSGNRPRILMVATNAYPAIGGVETHLHEVCPRIVRAGFDVTILATDRTGDLPECEDQGGVQVRRVPAWPRNRDYYVAPAVYSTIRTGDWDLVHMHGYHTFVAPLALLAATRSRIPTVLTFHSGGHGSRVRNRLRTLHLLALRPLLRRAGCLIAVSQFEMAVMPAKLRLARSRFALIPNGASMERPVDAGPPDEEPLILSVGRLEKYKGHHRVINAFPHVVAELPSARLQIVGAGPEEEALRKLAASLGVAERVTIGRIDSHDRASMARLMSRSSLVVLLSEYEANPVAVMEALGMGCRVLVADTSGLSEFAARGLARAVPLHSQPRETARAIVEQIATQAPGPVALPGWDACAAGLVAVYRSVLGLHPAGDARVTRRPLRS